MAFENPPQIVPDDRAARNAATHATARNAARARCGSCHLVGHGGWLLNLGQSVSADTVPSYPTVGEVWLRLLEEYGL
jgi:hypothetical protein